jgi:hypothetical protein
MLDKRKWNRGVCRECFRFWRRVTSFLLPLSIIESKQTKPNEAEPNGIDVLLSCTFPVFAETSVEEMNDIGQLRDSQR